MPIYKTGKIKDGKTQYRVQVNYTDQNGEYKSKVKTVYGSGEAKLCEQQILFELNEAPASTRMTVNELYEAYIDAKKHDVRITSLNKTKQVLSTNVLPLIGTLRLDKLNNQNLQKWKNEINEKDLSITTKKNIYAELRAMLNFAVRMDYLQRNPLEKIGNFKEVYFEKPQDKLRYYTAEQFKIFINEAEKDPSPSAQPFYVFFNIAFFTGMRKGEINALKWSDIEGDIIHVRRSVAQKIKGSPIVEGPPKNRSSYRDLQMPKTLVKILEKHKAYQSEMPGFSEDFRVCGGADCLSDTNIDLHNRKYAEAANLPRIKIHDFRHSHASLLANEGINIQEIARRLGHAKIEMTWNTYSHLYPREEERAVKILDSI